MRTDILQNEATTAEVDLGALRHNLRQIRTLLAPDCRILAVVKANAYGHGATLVSRTLVEEGVTMLGVGRVAEGIELRKAGIRARILLLGGALGEAAGEIVRHDLRPVVYHLENITAFGEAARKQGRPLHVHIKVETGMSRLGFAPEQVGRAIAVIDKHEYMRVEGLLTHFAAADSDPEFTAEQLKRFQKVREKLKANSLLTHAANSAGILQRPDAHFHLVRPGILLYGYLPSLGLQPNLALKPVLKWKTRIVQIREIPAGATVSYSRTFTAQRATRIAVLPVGYADGFLRSLTTLGEVLIRGCKAKVVGTVCMDLLMVDVTGLEGIKIGDEAVLIGDQMGNSITAWEVAERLGTIPYEVLCMISSRVPRVEIAGSGSSERKRRKKSPH